MDASSENNKPDRCGQDYTRDGESGICSEDRKVPGNPSERSPGKAQKLSFLPTELLWQIMGHLPLVQDKTRLMRSCGRVYEALFEKFYQERFDRDGSGEHKPLDGLFLLCYASLRGHIDILRIGLNRPGRGPLAYINRLLPPYDHETRILWLSSGLSDYYHSYRDGHFHLAPLHHAVIAQNTEVVRELLAHSADANVIDGEGRTPLHYAIDEEVIRNLLAAGASPLHKDTPFMGQMTPLATFLTGGSFFEKRTGKYVQTPAALRCLIDATRDADPDWSIDDTMGWHGQTPLEVAVRAGSELARVVLEAGANPNIRFVVALGGHHPDTVGGSKGRILDPALQIAAKIEGPRSIETMQLLVKYGARINDVVNGRSALMIAARGDDHEKTRWLVEHGARVNDAVNGRTALTEAVKGRDRENVRWLIEKCGADINVSLNDLISKFQHGVEYKRPSAVPNSPLWQAIRLKDVKMVELLVSLGADVRGVATLPVIGHLMDLWSCPYSPDKLQHGPEDEAADSILRLLLANGADINVGMPMTVYFYFEHQASRNRRRKPHVWPRRVQKWQESEKQNHIDLRYSVDQLVRSVYEPALGTTTYAVISDEKLDRQKRCLESKYHDGIHTTQQPQIFRKHRKWTMLDHVMIFHNPSCVKNIMERVDPLNQLTHSSQMRNTALGKLIRTVHSCYTRRSFMGPWTYSEWEKATVFLEFHGPHVTAKFPTGLLAQGLAQSVARLSSPRHLETRIRAYARLTNHDGRWGADGISGLEALVRHPAYWHLHARRPHLGGAWRRGEAWWEIDDHLLGAARVVHELAKKSSRPPAADEPQTPWWTTRWFERERTKQRRARYQPLPDDEYRTAFAVLFREPTASNIKSSRRKGRSRKKATGRE